MLKGGRGTAPPSASLLPRAGADLPCVLHPLKRHLPEHTPKVQLPPLNPSDAQTPDHMASVGTLSHQDAPGTPCFPEETWTFMQAEAMPDTREPHGAQERPFPYWKPPHG